MSSPFPRVEPGAVVAGRWHVTQLIGRGDLGQVFEVLDGPAGRVYALKLFTPDALRGNAWQEYQSSARSASSIAVDTISKVHELGIDPALGAPFAVGERILWPSLDEELQSSRPFALKRVASILELMAPALDSAHLAGLVHRDLRPSNVFTAKHVATGARITDFGVRALRAAAAPPPGWAAPAGWAAPDAIDRSMASAPSMDVFALGTLAFFLLTGKNPFRAMQPRPLDHGVLWNELITPFPTASERARELGSSLPVELDAWFAKALSLHPKARFSTISEMAKAFASSSAGAQAASPQVALPAPAGNPALKRTALGLGSPLMGGEVTAPPRPTGALPVGSPSPIALSPTFGGAGTAKVPRLTPAAAAQPPPLPAPPIVPSPVRVPAMPPLPAPRVGKPTMLGLGAPTEAELIAAMSGSQVEPLRAHTPLGLGEPLAARAEPPLGLGEIAPLPRLERAETPLGLGDVAAPAPPEKAAAPAALNAPPATSSHADSNQPAAAMPSYRAPAPSTSDSGPIALASAKPLAFMPDFPPPPALVRAAKEHAARAALPSASEPVVPLRRGSLLPWFLLGGVLVAVGSGFILWNRLLAAPVVTESVAAAHEAPAEAPAASVPVAPQASAPNPPSEPTATASAAPPEPTDALVIIKCVPRCEMLECDDKKLDSPADGVRLAPGKHVCKGTRDGFMTRSDEFSVEAGKDQTRELVLYRPAEPTERVASREPASPKPAAAPKPASPAAKAKPKPCGTFINPCK